MKETKLAHYLVLIGLIFGIAFVAGCSNNPNTDTSTAKCTLREDDTEGYLLKICEFIQENGIGVSPADPTKYNIKKIEEGWYPLKYNRETNQHEKTNESREVLVVYLDCCYMGDVAYIDKETKEVISFSLGAK